MRPELNEVKKQFIKRGSTDELIISLYPDPLERLKYLSSTFDQASEDEGFKAHLNSIFKGIKGDKGEDGNKGLDGDKGEKGDKPIKGVDYLTENEIVEVKQRLLKEIEKIPPKVIDQTVTKEIKIEVLPEKIVDLIMQTLEGLDFSMSALQIKNSLESLKGDQRLDAKYIKNLPKTRMIGGGAGSSNAGGATLFTNLIDVPNSYAGQAGKTVTVKGTEDGLEFSTPAGGGDMLAATYDPQNIADDAFDRANHTGVQGVDTISGLNELILAYAIVL